MLSQPTVSKLFEQSKIALANASAPELENMSNYLQQQQKRATQPASSQAKEW